MSGSGEQEDSEYVEESESEEAGSSEVDGSDDDPDSEPDEEEAESMKKWMSVIDKTFEEMELPPKVVTATQKAWNGFVSVFEKREAAADAIYGAFFDASPNLQGMFRAPRAAMGLRILAGIETFIINAGNPAGLRKEVEAIAFNHLDLDVTGPRVEMFRESTLEVFDLELGALFGTRARLGLSAVMTYAGGAYIHCRREYAGRIRILQRSWNTAAKKGADVEMIEDLDSKSDEEEEEEEVPQETEAANELAKTQEGQEGTTKASALKVPTTFDEMFLFNAAVMGYANSNWMKFILEYFDPIVTNVANSYRLQEECDVLSLNLAKCKGEINLPEFKAVMLASLRSLVPKDWNSQHEVAWNWLWENVERLLRAQLGKPRAQQKAIERFLVNLSQEALTNYCRDVYKRFFQLAPSGQDFFKQSTTRLFFIAEKIVEMTVEMYRTPKKMVEELSGLGLRHVGYGVPTELFSPYVSAAVEVIRGVTTDETTETAFRWSLTLIAKIMVRTLVEGSTVVMQAINTNVEKNLRRAISVAPRGKRAMELLKITVGTQSISPLYWAIESGSLICAEAMLQDLLTIRADRDNYYYGADALFTRHPEVIKKLASSAPSLLDCLLEGLIWRSRVIVNGTRRVNCYLKHLVQDIDGNPHQALQWLVEYGNPITISMFTVVLVADLMWTRLVAYQFLIGRCYFLFTLCVAVTSQSLLTLASPDATETFESNIVVFSCRVFLYLGSMCKILYNQLRLLQLDCKNRAFERRCCLPIPQYLFSLKEVGNFLLMWVLLGMCIREPLWWCAQFTNTEEALIFTTHCEAAKGDGRRLYSAFSCIAILLYWSLVLDFTIFSMHISAYVLVFGRVLSEVFLFVMALAFMIVAFASAVSAIEHELWEFAGINTWLISLTQMSLGMFPQDSYEELKAEAGIMIVIIGFVLMVSVILVNLLVAQLNQAYQHVYTDMQGYARLNRAAVIVSTLEQISHKRWARFLKGLKLNDRLEFNEGDVGLPGGVQIVEPASAHIVTEDSIRRFGGSSATTMPWPEEDDSMEDRFDRLEKLFMSTAKKMGGKRRKKKGDGGSSLLSGLSGANSGGSDDSGGSGDS
ncbi:unnamed protein product [Symbiodinium microadriaticum]|nr:unnamed protein product [Symbiodinium microadriaticum]CAE7896468.1 unnamed protein product [Symbiodinium sp. KB8]